METSLYLFITYSIKNQENANDFNCIKTRDNDQKLECIYSIENFENGMYFYKKVFKINKSNEKEKKLNKYLIIFEIGNNLYKISFDNKGNTFIYDVSLEIGKKIIEKEIWITVEINLEYYKKMEHFIKALEKNEEKNKLDELYKDTINIYFIKKDFSLLITLFLKIYTKKDLCNQLLLGFKKMNENLKEKEKHLDRK